jgi:cell fate (sporulation/competence/biofilm development) regulator YlbF (YheA/YmcA/DUF963 family)
MEQWERWNKDVSKHPFHTGFNPFHTQMRITTAFGKTINDNFRPDLKNNTLLRHLIYRRSINMNSFVACVGNVRTGKSYFCLKYAEDYTKECDKDFSVKNQCSFDILHFLKWSKDARDSAYVLDEIQLQMSPREWFDLQHRVFNAFCDVQGLRRNILLMPFPNISFIDKHLRFLINYIVRTTQQGKVLLFKLETRHELGKSWLNKIGSIRFKQPSEQVITDYEIMKKEFTDRHLDESIDLIETGGSPTEKELQKMQYRQTRIDLNKTSIEYMKYIMNKPVITGKQADGKGRGECPLR